MAILNTILNKILGDNKKDLKNDNNKKSHIKPEELGEVLVSANNDTNTQVAQLVVAVKNNNILLKSSLDIHGEQISLLEKILDAIKNGHSENNNNNNNNNNFGFNWKNWFKRSSPSAKPAESALEKEGEEAVEKEGEEAVEKEGEEAVEKTAEKKGILSRAGSAAKTFAKGGAKLIPFLSGGIAAYDDYKERGSLGHAAAVGIGSGAGSLLGEIEGLGIGSIPVGLGGYYAGGAISGGIYDKIANWWGGNKDAQLVSGANLTANQENSDKINALMAQKINQENNQIAANKLEFAATENMSFSGNEAIINANDLVFEIDQNSSSSNQTNKPPETPDNSSAPSTPFNPLTSTGGDAAPVDKTPAFSPLTSTGSTPSAPAFNPLTSTGGDAAPVGKTPVFSPLTSTGSTPSAPATSTGSTPSTPATSIESTPSTPAFSPLTSTGALPHYEQGTDNVPSTGPAIVGENNKPEIIQSKSSGLNRIAPAGEHSEILDKGDKVIPIAKASHKVGRAAGRADAPPAGSVSSFSPWNSISSFFFGNSAKTDASVKPNNSTYSDTNNSNPYVETSSPKGVFVGGDMMTEQSSSAIKMPNTYAPIADREDRSLKEEPYVRPQKVGRAAGRADAPPAAFKQSSSNLFNIHQTPNVVIDDLSQYSPEGAVFQQGDTINNIQNLYTRSSSQNERNVPIKESIQAPLPSNVPLPPRRPKFVNKSHHHHKQHHGHNQHHAHGSHSSHSGAKNGNYNILGRMFDYLFDYDMNNSHQLLKKHRAY